MAPERTTRINRPEEEPEHQHPEMGAASASETEEPRPAGFGARLRQLVAQSRQGASHPNIQRQQLKQDRTKSFLMLAGSMVVMALMFFAMFSSPSSNRHINSAHPNTPNLGRGPGGEKTGDDGHSVTPLLNADTRNPNDAPSGVTAEDVHNTARRNALGNASPSFGPPVATPAPSTPRPATNDYALNRIDFPAEPQPNTKPDDLVFPSERGTFLSRDNFLRRNIQKKLATVGLGWVNFQVLRRTQASLGHMEGIDPKVAADQRGHGIGVAIDTYTTTDVESRREAVTRLEVALKDEEGTRNSKGSPRQGFRGKQGKGEFGGRS